MNAPLRRPSVSDVCRELAFDEIADAARMAAVYALAVARAAERRDQTAVRVRLNQTRLCAVHAIRMFKDDLGEPDSGGAIT